MRAKLTHPSRRTFLGASAAALASPGLLGASTPATRVLTGAAFGTSWQVTLPAGARPEELRAPVQAMLDGIDRQMSPWRADSDVGRFNAAPAGPRPMPAETVAVTGAALRIAARSAGHFDPTVGPLVARWGFGPIEGAEAPDWHGLAAGDDHVAKARDGLTLDLCGIAKGHALDRMADLLHEAGHRDFLVDLGGELAARGLHPSGRPWRVAVEDPRPGQQGIDGVLALSDGAVATSGLRAQSYVLDGRRYGHIIDPRSGEPVAGRLLSVSVLDGSAMQADGWATALFAAGAAGPDLARAEGIDALFVMADGRGGLRRTLTGRAGAALAAGATSWN